MHLRMCLYEGIKTSRLWCCRCVVYHRSLYWAPLCASEYPACGLNLKNCSFFLFSHITRGIRQGCRHSALRFVIIVETMAAKSTLIAQRSICTIWYFTCRWFYYQYFIKKEKNYANTTQNIVDPVFMPIFDMPRKSQISFISIIMFIFVYLVRLQHIRRILVHIFWSTYINTMISVPLQGIWDGVLCLWFC